MIETLQIPDSPMRRVLIGIVLLLLLATSIGVGVAVARWPTLMLAWHDSTIR